ncbi:uncharacterized protein LOC132033656 isoform X3 [Lycium ferocissimum]|uniref:uncharacterized protein LOC132033656 isoform X3 n=1 Tax=Lycium ferocissimum TaxID=112874 RepID=UPI002815FAFD|nr:uncharacterized protein LOC132033656 isoform X3 [Lycium ferocissimum]
MLLGSRCSFKSALQESQHKRKIMILKDTIQARNRIVDKCTWNRTAKRRRNKLGVDLEFSSSGANIFIKQIWYYVILRRLPICKWENKSINFLTGIVGIRNEHDNLESPASVCRH